MIQFSDRVLLVGTTGCGKSTLAKQLFLATRGPRLVIDPSDSALTTVPGVVTFSDPTRARNRRGEDWRQAATARFVPDDPYDLAAYDQVYRWAFDRFPRYVWADEAGFVMPARGAPKAARRYLIQGRKRQLGHLACHTRPIEIDRNLIGQGQHVFVFETPQEEDRRTVAGNVGINFRRFEQIYAEAMAHHVQGLDNKTKRGYLWCAPGEVIICPPLTPAQAAKLAR